MKIINIYVLAFDYEVFFYSERKLSEKLERFYFFKTKFIGPVDQSIFYIQN